MKVEVYVEPLKTYFNYCGHGHNKKICKKEAICWTYGKGKHENGEECPRCNEPICIHCHTLDAIKEKHSVNRVAKKANISNCLTVNTENFLRLKQTGASKTFQLKKIGGINAPEANKFNY
ncbi:hypothetical protein KPH14_001207 [Odynerus spinipes]|uniref:Uncharacterized protein n=1 Tax=Odynerus spinipes TaxID=1348599 RepID=A0AAD9RQJ6_9HYME|nr:hypothetical protein KPH14_001207 [Odynerus spinipes]